MVAGFTGAVLRADGASAVGATELDDPGATADEVGAGEEIEFAMEGVGAGCDCTAKHCEGGDEEGTV